MFNKKPPAAAEAKSEANSQTNSQTNRSELSAGLASAGTDSTATLIANNTRIVGDVFFEEQLYVNGVIEGDVTAMSAKPPEGSRLKQVDAAPAIAGSASNSGGDTLVVCDGGRVVGEIRSPNVVIDGTVEGDVYATEKLELAAKARVLGNVHYNLVEMHLGSVVNGQMLNLAKAAKDAKSERDAQEQAKQKMREAAGDVVTGIR